jgi:alkaline phosphatase D
LGPVQENWLAQGLNRSRRAWKLLGQSTQMAPSGIDAPWLAAGGAPVRAVYTDGWDGYPQARQRLLRGIAEAGVTDVLVLGGDVHYNMAGNLRLRPNDDRSAVLASEFVTTSISSHGMADTRLQALRASNPDMAYARSDQRGYTLLELTPRQARGQFRATAEAQLEDATLTQQAVYAVERGRAGVHKA